MNIDIGKITGSLLPVLLAAMWWLISSINHLQLEINSLKGNMMLLITPNGTIIPSPGNREARSELKEELVERLTDLHVRLKLVEEKQSNP
jgi:hypothetical protein